MKQTLNTLRALYVRLAALALVVGLVVRIVLLFNEQTVATDFTAGEWLKIFLLGAVNDLAVVTLGCVPLALFLLSVSQKKYQRPWGWLILAVLVGGLCYVLFFNSIFHQKI